MKNECLNSSDLADFNLSLLLASRVCESAFSWYPFFLYIEGYNLCLRISMEPPAVSTSCDLGSAHFSLTVPLHHVFDGLSMMRIGYPGYNGGSADFLAVLLHDVVI